MSWEIRQGDALERLREMLAGSVQTTICSPPYFGLRDYSADGQIGLEATPDAYVARLVEVFREVRRVLRDDGTLWLNLGDSYASAGGAPHGGYDGGILLDRPNHTGTRGRARRSASWGDVKQKDLLGIPWAVAEALRDPYYTGRIAAERDRVWMAAMIDGEGAICGFNHERSDGDGVRTGINLCITNSSDALLAEAERIWPASRCEHMNRDGALGNKPCWRWLVHGIENKTQFIREVYPHLIVKRKQAVLAYNLLVLMADAKKLGHSPQRDVVREKRALLVRLMSEANKGDCDVPSWCAEPPSVFEPGWYLRSDIVWSKPNPMPESVTDRPTKAHEYLFLLAKSPRYFYDADAVREPVSPASEFGRPIPAQPMPSTVGDATNDRRIHARLGNGSVGDPAGRNKRSVWTVATQPFPGAHFAVFPPKLIEPCVLAGSAPKACGVCGAPWERLVETKVDGKRHDSPQDARGRKERAQTRRWLSEAADASSRLHGQYFDIERRTVGWESMCGCSCPKCDGQGRLSDAVGVVADCIPCEGTGTDQGGSSVVLDPFAGAGTTGLVALQHGRSFIGIELSADYCDMARDRIINDAPLFNAASHAPAQEPEADPPAPQLFPDDSEPGRQVA